MSARRLGRLLGSVLALTALTGGALLADEPLALTTYGYEWASFGYEWATAGYEWASTPEPGIVDPGAGLEPADEIAAGVTGDR